MSHSHSGSVWFDNFSYLIPFLFKSHGFILLTVQKVLMTILKWIFSPLFTASDLGVEYPSQAFVVVPVLLLSEDISVCEFCTVVFDLSH